MWKNKANGNNGKVDTNSNKINHRNSTGKTFFSKNKHVGLWQVYILLNSSAIDF